MKKIIISAIALVALVAIGTKLNVRADYANFAGSAGYSAAKVSAANAKNNYQYLAGVNWTSSDHSGHKMWFRVRNSNNEERGNILINRPGNGVQYLEVTTKYGYNYWLYANREHIINPSTYVQGTWQP